MLVIDDESLIRWSLAQTLFDHGYTVMEAGDGKQALAVLRNSPEPVEVIMLDYRLPDTNGLQLLAAIRGISPDSRAVCVVTKPIEMQDVAVIVSRARAA